MFEITPTVLCPKRCEDFIYEAKSKINLEGLNTFQSRPALDLFQLLAQDIFQESIAKAKVDLEDDQKAIACLDIPDTTFVSPTENILWSLAISVAIQSLIMNPTSHHSDAAPFALVHASRDDYERLMEAGYHYSLPLSQLSFQTGSVFSASKLYLPEYLASYHIFLGFLKPGHFNWLPTASWQRFQEFCGKLADRIFPTRMIPTTLSVRERSLRLARSEIVEVPLLVENRGSYSLFLSPNLAIKSEEDRQLLEELRDSCKASESQFYIQQKEKRLIFCRNTRGLYARETGSLPLLDIGFTRSTLLAADKDGPCIRDFAKYA